MIDEGRKVQALDDLGLSDDPEWAVTVMLPSAPAGQD